MRVKTRRLLLILLSLVFVLLPACAASEPNQLGQELYESPALTHNPQLPAGEDLLDAASSEPKIQSVTYANIGFKENDLFATNSSQYFLPIFCIYDNGEQAFSNNLGTNLERWERASQILAQAPATETLELVNVKEHMFTGPERPDYGFDWVTTTGDWELFPEKIAYTSYDLEHQPNAPEWLEYFHTALAEYEIDSPVVIKDSWTFQWGGVESIIVTATNAIPCENGDQFFAVGEKPIPEELPVNQNPGVYQIAAMFREGQQPIAIKNLIKSLPNDMGRSVLADESNLGHYSHSISVVQYREDNTSALYPLFCGHSGEELIQLFWYSPEYLLCDTDGDGTAELVVFYRAVSSLYTGCVVYELANGVPVSSYHPFPCT